MLRPGRERHSQRCGRAERWQGKRRSLEGDECGLDHVEGLLRVVSRYWQSADPGKHLYRGQDGVRGLGTSRILPEAMGRPLAK